MAGEVLNPGAVYRSVKGYENLIELGRGGMGVAHLARTTGAGGFERFVVIKRLHKHLTEEAEALERFLHEARLAAYVNHANVVGVQHADVDEAGPYIVLDYVEGPSVDELSDRALIKGESIPIPILLRVALDALSGLEAIHRARRPGGELLSILHRDVTPHNILVGRDGVTRVADFGVAKSTLRTVSTDKGYVVGKILYLAPEYLRQQPVGPALDVYGLGISLWVTLAGKEPWPEADDAQLLTKVFEEGFPPVETVSQTPPQVAAIVNRACAIDVADRYATARQMAEAIEQLGRETSWVASHSEVAEFVERVSGADLDRRRRVVAAAHSSTPVPLTTIRKRGEGVGPTSSARQHTGTMAVPTEPKPGSRRRWALLGAAAVAAALSAAAASLFTGERDAATPAEPASEGPNAATASTSEAPVASPDDQPPVLQVDSLPEAEDEPLDREPTPAPRRPGAAPRPAKRVGPAKMPVAPSPSHFPSPSPPTPAPPPAVPKPSPGETAEKPADPAPQAAPAPAPKAPSEITKKNPYR